MNETTNTNQNPSLSNVESSSEQMNTIKEKKLPDVETLASSIVDEAIQEAETFISSLETHQRL
jgi:hypothetical protein